MKFNFKRRIGKFKVEGDEASFRADIRNLQDAAADSSARITFNEPEDKLVIRGYGRDIAKILNELNFFVKASAPQTTLQMRITWYPASKDGVKNAAKSGAKSGAKRAAKLAARAGVDVASAGVTEGAELAKDGINAAKKVGKAFAKAVRKEIPTALDNLDQPWELRIKLASGDPGITDTEAGPIHRSENIGGESHSKELYGCFLRLVGAFVISVGNAVRRVTGEQPYMRLIDDEEVMASVEKAEHKAEKAANSGVKKSVSSSFKRVSQWFKDKRARRGYESFEDDDDDDYSPVRLEEESA